MSILQRLFLSISVLAVTIQPGENLNVIICEEMSTLLKCPLGSIVSTKSAEYGRWDAHTCPYGAIPRASCPRADVRKHIIARCQQSPDCLLTATNRVFGDPCVGTYKYLNISFDCETTDNIPTINKTEGSFPIITNVVCEGNILDIVCPPKSVITIFDLNYGRKDGRICPPTGYQACFSKRSRLLVKNECEGKNSCRLEASNNWVGEDPCVGTKKYITVSYICINPSKENKKSIACEGDIAKLDCHPGRAVKILNFKYGRRDPLTCSSASVGNNAANCWSNTGLSKAKSQCDGVTHCEISATNEVFGDPCPGTYKYIEVDYKCIRF